MQKTRKTSFPPFFWVTHETVQKGLKGSWTGKAIAVAVKQIVFFYSP
jgi:hypothetical protein